MTIEDIREDKAQLERRAEQLRADLHATMGAIQQCDAWIARMKKEATNLEPIVEEVE